MDTTSFVIESNAIEGVWQSNLEEDIKATDIFLALDEITLEAVEMLAKSYNASTVLVEPKREALQDLLSEPVTSPYLAHLSFMAIAPFTAANGLVGRTLWLWHMNKSEEQVDLPFLQMFYRQACLNFYNLIALGH